MLLVVTIHDNFTVNYMTLVSFLFQVLKPFQDIDTSQSLHPLRRNASLQL